MTWRWLSFASAEKFLGVAVVQAHSEIEASRLTHVLGINPGGEIACWPVCWHEDHREPPIQYTNRLLTQAECAQLCEAWFPEDPGISRLGDLDDYDRN